MGIRIACTIVFVPRQLHDPLIRLRRRRPLSRGPPMSSAGGRCRRRNLMAHGKRPPMLLLPAARCFRSKRRPIRTPSARSSRATPSCADELEPFGHSNPPFVFPDRIEEAEGRALIGVLQVFHLSRTANPRSSFCSTEFSARFGANGAEVETRRQLRSVYKTAHSPLSSLHSARPPAFH